jgi:hypothetical protein
VIRIVAAVEAAVLAVVLTAVMAAALLFSDRIAAALKMDRLFDCGIG